MFARSISIHLKPNSVAEFTRLIDEETLPLLWKQEGFQDEMTFVVPGGAEAFEISLWDHKENADAFNRNVYPRALKTWENVVEGTPEIRTYEVCSSSFHKIASCTTEVSQKRFACAKHASRP
jgi:hypothetical protein